MHIMKTHFILNCKFQSISIAWDSMSFIPLVSNSNRYLVLLYTLLILPWILELLEQHLFVIHGKELLSRLCDHLTPALYLLFTLLNLLMLHKMPSNCSVSFNFVLANFNKDLPSFETENMLPIHWANLSTPLLSRFHHSTKFQSSLISCSSMTHNLLAMSPSSTSSSSSLSSSKRPSSTSWVCCLFSNDLFSFSALSILCLLSSYHLLLPFLLTHDTCHLP